MGLDDASAIRAIGERERAVLVPGGDARESPVGNDAKQAFDAKKLDVGDDQ